MKQQGLVAQNCTMSNSTEQLAVASFYITSMLTFLKLKSSDTEILQCKYIKLHLHIENYIISRITT